MKSGSNSCLLAISAWVTEVVKWLRSFPVPRRKKRFGAGRRRLEPERVAQALELLKAGRSVRQVSLMTGLHRATVSRLAEERTPKAIVHALVVRAAKRVFRTDRELREELVQSHLDSLAEKEALRLATARGDEKD